MGNLTLKGTTAREYCQCFPDMPSLTLSKMLAADHPELFGATDAYNAVCYHRGKQGKKSRLERPNGTTRIATTAPDNRTRPEYRAPKSYAEPFDDFVIHGSQRVLRLSDVHYPFHDQWALEAAVNYGIKHDPTIILLDGDIMDCHDLSDHDRDPRHRYQEAELRMIADEFRQLKAAFPSARIIYKEGNHEHRLKRYLMRKAPELWGLPGLDIMGLIAMVGGADAITGIEWVEDKRVIRSGKLACLHGHEFAGGGGGVNPARWLFLRTGENAVCGHFHRTSEHSEPSLSREARAAWSTGCLCDMRPSYMPHNKWNHGFAWIDVEADGHFALKNLRIINGKTL
jgi:predicted phosphodiesterase